MRDAEEVRRGGRAQLQEAAGGGGWGGRGGPAWGAGRPPVRAEVRGGTARRGAARRRGGQRRGGRAAR